MTKLSIHSTICIWLAFLYIFSIALVTFSLTTYQLQHRLSKTLIKPPNSLSTLRYHDCDLIASAKNSAASGLQKILCIPLSVNSEKTYLTPSKVSEQNNHIRKFEKNLIDNKAKLKELLSVPDSNKEIISELESRVRASQDGLEMFRFQSQEINAVLKVIENHNKIYTSLFNIKYLWDIPKDILIIMLIFSMGALGSLIFLTIEFLKNTKEEEKFSVYFFRPLLGSIMALAVFVMFKSGQYMLGVEPEEHVSPFFISFISIISGMMTEKAYGSLTLQGETFFHNGNNGN